MPRRFRGSKNISRPRSKRYPARTLTVFCEGRVTEREYIRDLARHVRASSVTVAPARGDPQRLVESARAFKEDPANGLRAEDLVWCVFDADDHARLAPALDLARAANLSVALSNPSFELWALLHFADQTAYIERRAVRRELKRFVPKYGKRLPLARLLPGQDDAVARAQALEARHVANGLPAYENPSSSAWELVETIGRLRTAP